MFDRFKSKARIYFNRTKPVYNKTKVYVDRNPLRSFLIALGALLFIIVLASFLRKPQDTPPVAKAEVKQVETYNIGTVPHISVQAKVEKSGVITILALTPGVVQALPKIEGDYVQQGETVISLSTNYQGGNSSSLQRELAGTQYANAKDTYQAQKDIIGKQKDLANQSKDNTIQLQEITNKSIDSTKSIISLNNEIISSLDQQIASLPANDADALGVKQMKAQFLAANNAANQGLNNITYQGDSGKPPTQLANTQRDLAIRQLEVQEKMLDLNLNVSRIQLQIAQVAEAMMFPSSPFNGKVQRVFVKIGQSVTPGDKLMVIAQNIEEDPITAVALVPQDVAQKVSLTQVAKLYMNEKVQYSIAPSYVTQEAVEGSLYGVYFPIPDNYSKFLTDNGSIRIDLPVGYLQTTESTPYIPLDTVYQTRDAAYVYVERQGKAVSKKVELGNVYGAFVEVNGGLSRGDKVIINRNVIEGDLVN